MASMLRVTMPTSSPSLSSCAVMAALPHVLDGCDTLPVCQDPLHIDALFPHPGELVAQSSGADAQLFRRLLAMAATGAQGVQDQVKLPLLQVGVEIGSLVRLCSGLFDLAQSLPGIQQQVIVANARPALQHHGAPDHIVQPPP